MNEILRVPTANPRIYMDTRLYSPSDLLVLREIFSENVYEIADGQLTDTGIVIDIGANIGAFSLYAASLGAKRVIAVEPEPDNLRLLQRNIERCDIFDCEYTIVGQAIGEKKSKIYISSEHGDSHKTTEDNGTLVAQITLEQLLKENDIEYVDILKIDIEGMEGEVILSTPQHIMERFRYITVEYDRNSTDLGAIVEKLIQTHQIKVVGSHGGMIFANRY